MLVTCDFLQVGLFSLGESPVDVSMIFQWCYGFTSWNTPENYVGLTNISLRLSGLKRPANDN